MSIRPKLERIWNDDRRWTTIAIVASVAAHLTVFYIALSELPSWLSPPLVLAGDPDGADGANIEIVDAASIDSKAVAFKAGRDDVDHEPTAARSIPEASPNIVQQQPIPDNNPPSDEGGEFVSAPAKAVQKQSPMPQPTVSKKMSDAEIKRLAESMIAELDEVLIRQASSAQRGEASPFVRGVLRILKLAMPRPSGAVGRMVVQLVVSRSGTLEALSLVQSSGRPELDRQVVESIRTAHLIAPAKDTPDRERLFTVTYVYK